MLQCDDKRARAAILKTVDCVVQQLTSTVVVCSYRRQSLWCVFCVLGRVWQADMLASLRHKC